jgi:hypothetical protein
MENQRTRAYLFWRYGSLGVSFLLYLLCLPLDAFCVSGQCSAWPGYGILLFGPLGVLASITNWTWFANPTLFVAWATQALGAKKLSAAFSVAAFAIAISFLFQREIMTNEAGILLSITGYRIGYWIWLSSIAVCCFGSMATIELSAGYKRTE